MEGLLHPASHTWWGRLQHALPFQPYGCHTSITTQENRLMIHRLLSPCISIGVRSLVLCLATPRWFPWAPFWTSLHADRGFCLLLCGENPIDELLQCPQKMTCVHLTTTANSSIAASTQEASLSPKASQWRREEQSFRIIPHGSTSQFHSWLAVQDEYFTLWASCVLTGNTILGSPVLEHTD